jgi:hypothetical protein
MFSEWTETDRLPHLTLSLLTLKICRAPSITQLANVAFLQQ